MQTKKNHKIIKEEKQKEINRKQFFKWFHQLQVVLSVLWLIYMRVNIFFAGIKLLISKFYPVLTEIIFQYICYI